MKILITPKSYKSVFQQMKPFLKGLEVVINDTGKSFSQAEMLERIENVDGLLVGRSLKRPESLRPLPSTE